MSERTTRDSASPGTSQPVLAPCRSTSGCIGGREGRQMGLCPSVRTGFGVRHLPHEGSRLAGRLSCFLARIARPGITVPARLPAGSPLCWHRPFPILCCGTWCPPAPSPLPLLWADMFCKSRAVEAVSAFCLALPHAIISVFCSIARLPSFSRLYF